MSIDHHDRQAELDAIADLAEQVADALAEVESRCRRNDINPLTGRTYTVANCGCEMCAETVAEWRRDDRDLSPFDESEGEW